MIRSTQGAEELVKKYEDQLKDVQTVPADLKELEASKAELKVTALARAEVLRDVGSCQGWVNGWAR